MTIKCSMESVEAGPQPFAVLILCAVLFRARRAVLRCPSTGMAGCGFVYLAHCPHCVQPVLTLAATCWLQTGIFIPVLQGVA